MKSYILLLAGFVCLTNWAWSQDQVRSQTKEYPQFVHIEDAYAADQGADLLQKLLELNAYDELIPISDQVDHLGMRHVKYAQAYKGVSVEWGSYTIHSKEGVAQTATGSFFDIEDLDVHPQMDAQASTSYAHAVVPPGADIIAPGGHAHDDHGHAHQHDIEIAFPVLVIIDAPGDRQGARLAWKHDVYSMEPIYRADVFVDANTGALIFENEKIHEADVPASGPTLYNGNRSFTADRVSSTSYRLRQSTQGVETYNMNNGTNYGSATDFTSSSSTFNGDQTGNQAHWGAEQTHDYYLSEHNRNSYNGSGATIRSYVHYSNNYVNAFWDGSRMTYGDGDGTNYGPLVSLDIVGHEITHGVTQNTANLVYQNESGALNESFSDIFGESIEHHALGSNDWLMGDDIGIGGSGAIRSMSNPNQFSDPDTYGGTYWYTGSGDNGGVHINSGVQNKWFYILVNGESGTNDLGNAYSVSGIGIDKAEDIAWRNLSVYLSSSSVYADARTGAIQAAVDLFGAGSAEEIAVTNAWYAVGVGGEYGTVNYCASRGNNATYEWISNVTIGAFSNSSGAAGYTDFTGQTVSVNAGSSYSVSLTPSFSGSTYNESWKIWIDLNGDGDFSDSGELVFNPGSLSSTTVTGTMNIPSGASGTTRMRVSMKWDAAQTECEVFSYGEVEDYTVDIGSGGGGGDTQAPTTPTGVTASNVTSSTADISWNASSDNVGVTGYNVYVNGSLAGSVTGTTASLTGLTASTNYTVGVSAYDAAGNESSQGSTSFTTPSGGDTQAPTTPAGVTASNVGQTSADISWNASSDNVGVAGYNVYVDGSFDQSVTGTSVSLTGLSSSTSYTVGVSAYDAAGNESSQGSTSFTTQSSGGGGGSTTVLSADFFETGWDGWIDGGSDCYRYSGGRSYEGSRSIRIRDNSGTASSMTKTGYNLSAYNAVEVEFYFYPNSMETGEDFWVRYNSGSGWQTVAAYASGTNFTNGSFYVATVTLSDLDYNLSSNAQFRFQCDASSNADRIYIDAVTITGVSGSGLLAESGQTIRSLGSATQESIFGSTIGWNDSAVRVAPNPTSDVIRVEAEDEIHSISIYNISGQMMRHIEATDSGSAIDVSTFRPGVYIIEIQAGEEMTRERIVKQ